MNNEPINTNQLYSLIHTDVEGIDSLIELALDIRWSWNHAADTIWQQLEPSLWELTRNPWVVLQTEVLIKWLQKQEYFGQVNCIGHRVVHDMEHSQPEIIDNDLLEELHKISEYDPDHLPAEIEMIELFKKEFPKLVQFALFKKEKRAFSHGCIRLEEPQKMAEYLLRNQPEWTTEKISEAMSAAKEKWVTLNKPVPVFITYFTSWVSNDGLLNFREDIYGHDRNMAERMFEDVKVD